MDQWEIKKKKKNMILQKKAFEKINRSFVIHTILFRNVATIN